MPTFKPKLRKAWNEPGHAHFVTYSCFQGYKLLSKDRTRWWVIEALQRTRQKRDLTLFAYVIMPEHVHVALLPRRADYRMEHILAGLKRNVSKQAKCHLIESGNEQWLKRLTAKQGKREVFHFWQTGGGFDRNVWREKSLYEMMEYIHANPVRRGLVEHPTDWHWSSARFWDGDRSGPLDMDLIDA
ncbi:MAG: transposase [Planctomycetes bacterium]|nr:transposase [Planctomycetota bacterium]